MELHVDLFETNDFVVQLVVYSEHLSENSVIEIAIIFLRKKKSNVGSYILGTYLSPENKKLLYFSLYCYFTNKNSLYVINKVYCWQVRY